MISVLQIHDAKVSRIVIEYVETTEDYELIGNKLQIDEVKDLMFPTN